YLGAASSRTQLYLLAACDACRHRLAPAVPTSKSSRNGRDRDIDRRCRRFFTLSPTTRQGFYFAVTAIWQQSTWASVRPRAAARSVTKEIAMVKLLPSIIVSTPACSPNKFGVSANDYSRIGLRCLWAALRRAVRRQLGLRAVRRQGRTHHAAVAAEAAGIYLAARPDAFLRGFLAGHPGGTRLLAAGRRHCPGSGDLRSADEQVPSPESVSRGARGTGRTRRVPARHPVEW